MQTTDQVAGEAREKLADEALARIADEIEQNLREHPNRPMKRMLLTDEVWSAVAAALRAQPERGAEEMRERAAACAEDPNQWLRYWNGKPFNATIAAAIRALPLHPAKDEGGGHG